MTFPEVQRGDCYKAVATQGREGKGCGDKGRAAKKLYTAALEQGRSSTSRDTCNTIFEFFTDLNSPNKMEDVSILHFRDHNLISSRGSSGGHLRSHCCSVTKSCLTLHNPWTAARQASLSITASHSLPKFIASVMPSNHLMLSPSSLSAFNLSQYQGLFH